MEQYIPKSVLVAEMDRQIELLKPFLGACAGQIVAEVNAKLSVLEGLKIFLNSLEVKEPVSKDLEEAAKHYLYNNILYDDVYVGNPTDKDCIEMFKAGAEWQKQQAQETIELAEDHAMFAGMNKMEQQLMAKAIDGTARPDDNEIWCILDSFNLKDGDKVKVIVIKEDEL